MGIKVVVDTGSSEPTVLVAKPATEMTDGELREFVCKLAKDFEILKHEAKAHFNQAYQEGL